jgi:A/G-specific adenine glycosylase
MPGKFRLIPGLVRHAFTHFELELRVFVAEDVAKRTEDGVWARLDDLQAFALPNVMRKVIAHALGQNAPGPLFAAAKDTRR